MRCNNKYSFRKPNKKRNNYTIKNNAQKINTLEKKTW